MAKKEKQNYFSKIQERQQKNMQEIEIDQHEGDEMVGMSMRVPAEMRRRLRQHYAQTGESMNALIVRLIKKELYNN